MSYNSNLPPRAITTPRNVSGRTQRGSISVENHTLARSFVYSSFKPDLVMGTTPTVHSTNAVHEQAADLAEVGVTDLDSEVMENEINASSTSAPFKNDSSSLLSFSNPNLLNDMAAISQENTRLSVKSDTLSYGSVTPSLPRTGPSSGAFGETDLDASFRQQYGSPQYGDDLESLKPKKESITTKVLNEFRNYDRKNLVKDCVTRPIQYLPAVFLGTLLNILDALSYGMIMFPIGETVFSSMGAHGLSMFYVSTIISQLIYSSGASAFKSAIGSEMIEVTPFFHQMAIQIMIKIGEDKQDAILSTTIVTFALSSVVTGVCFLILGKCKLGKLVGFFPRHILVGCIGGVGYFLVVTGIEVSSRIEGGIEYNWETLSYLLEPLVFLEWIIPLLLALLLVILQHYNRSALIVPLYFIAVFAIFHLLIFIVPSWDLQTARDFGWIFPAQESSEPWYGFYKLYNFKIVDWWAVIGQIPTMLALTFFGVLHVPINVPALAVTIGMDDFDVDRELMAHGISNTVSGLFGSIQNYLVYTNSVLFIRAGADSRLSGIMLAMATTAIMLIGPGIIGYIPVCVVGALIYLLGYELLKEALYDTLGKLRKFEYITIVIIVITMGAWDFVYGILVGILLACVSFVVEAGSKPVISGIYTGEYARSIVIRHPKQREFLKNVGKQIYIMKLHGSLFFGSIGGLEEKIRLRFDHSNFAREPIKYLILDMNNVLGIDFSAAEGFRRIRNILMEKNCYLIISSISEDSSIVQALRDCGLWETEEHNEKIQLFNSLNSALEWSENLFLEHYKDLLLKTRHSSSFLSNSNQKRKLPIALQYDDSSNFSNKIAFSDSSSPVASSPRNNQIWNAAKKAMRSDHHDILLNRTRGVSTSTRQPLTLVLTAMQGLSDITDEVFWNKLSPYLTKMTFQPGDLIYNKSCDQPSLFFVENGLIDYEIGFKKLNFFINSSVLPLTLFGDLAISHSDRSVRYYSTTSETTVWKLDMKSIAKLIEENDELYKELLVVSLRLAINRHDTITSNLLVSA